MRTVQDRCKQTQQTLLSVKHLDGLVSWKGSSTDLTGRDLLQQHMQEEWQQKGLIMSIRVQIGVAEGYVHCVAHGWRSTLAG